MPLPRPGTRQMERTTGCLGVIAGLGGCEWTFLQEQAEPYHLQDRTGKERRSPKLGFQGSLDTDTLKTLQRARPPFAQSLLRSGPGSLYSGESVPTTLRPLPVAASPRGIGLGHLTSSCLGPYEDATFWEETKASRRL